MGMYLEIASLLFFLLFFLIFSHRIKKKRKERKYFYLLQQYYAVNELVQALEEIEKELNSKTIGKALYYIKYMPLKDYKGAFYIIEKEFKHDKIKALHKRILEIEEKNCIFCLEQKTS